MLSCQACMLCERESCLLRTADSKNMQNSLWLRPDCIRLLGLT